MKARRIKKSLCLLLCLGLATAAMAQSDRPSVLDRVQNVDDPELSELIRVAIENQAKLRQSSQEETLELTRKVTLGYTRIKLLDEQIEQVSHKIEANTGPAEMLNELRLAKMELESKLLEEVADLRKAMGITPRHPFDKKSAKVLNTWLHLHVLDHGVHVIDSLKPLTDLWWGYWRLKSSGFQSEREVLDYVRERLQNKTNLPIRICLHHAAATRSSAEDLRKRIISLIREADCQMEAEVSLELIKLRGSGESTFFIREGTISTLHKAGDIKRPDGGSEPILTGVVEQNDLDQHILWRLTHPGNIPLKYRVEYDQTSAKLARQTADRISAIVKDMGIGEYVDVERIFIEAVPETAFLGRWQATTRGEVQTIDIQPTGECVFVQSPGSKVISSETNVPGKWFLTPKDIFMDIKDARRDSYYLYRGRFDKRGNLVVNRGIVYRQGSFHTGPKLTTVFKKVY